MKLNRIKLTALSLLLTIGLAMCSDNNDNPTPEFPNGQWGETMKGNGEYIGAYPDLYSNYWEFTYNMEGNEGKAICLEGEFPYARYFSISLYNDETGDAIGGINDSEIEPANGSVNPFRETTSSTGRFKIYVVAEGTDKNKLAALNAQNVCEVKKGVNKVAIFVRQYLGTDASGTTSHEYGGVELPAISAIDIASGKSVAVPEHVHSNVYDATSNVYVLKSDENKEVPFFLSPVSKYYPNNSTAYLYARTRLRTDSVLSFSFIPAPVPAKAEQYADAVTRYWSICLGAASDTRSYYSLCDRNADWKDGEKAEFIVCLKNNPRLEEIKTRVEQMKRDGEKANLFIWDSEKQNIDGKPLGEYIAIMYRNILPNDSWEHSIATMLPTEYFDGKLEPIDHVTNPDRQLAHIALGDYGPYGLKKSTEEFLKDF
ncbi:MAG: hypothetical protein K1W02_06425 [Muribaculaceae bacterium]